MGNAHIEPPAAAQTNIAVNQRLSTNNEHSSGTTVTANNTLDTNDPLQNKTLKRRRRAGACQDELWTRWLRLDSRGRERTCANDATPSI